MEDKNNCRQVTPLFPVAEVPSHPQRHPLSPLPKHTVAGQAVPVLSSSPPPRQVQGQVTAPLPSGGCTSERNTQPTLLTSPAEPSDDPLRGPTSLLYTRHSYPLLSYTLPFPAGPAPFAATPR